MKIATFKRRFVSTLSVYSSKVLKIGCFYAALRFAAIHLHYILSISEVVEWFLSLCVAAHNIPFDCAVNSVYALVVNEYSER